MEQLIYLINELEEEKEKLLIEKEENLKIIESLDKKIDYYKYIIGRYDWGIKSRKKQLESYNNILDFSKGHHSLFSLHLYDDPMESYIENRVDKFEEEIKDIVSSRKLIHVLLSVVKKNQNDLKESNEQIDLRISEIDKEIDFKCNSESCEKVYKLERGN